MPKPVPMDVGAMDAQPGGGEDWEEFEWHRRRRNVAATPRPRLEPKPFGRVACLAHGSRTERRRHSAGRPAESQSARHKQQLRSLKKADPEFYKFMQEEGEEELGFGAGARGREPRHAEETATRGQG